MTIGLLKEELPERRVAMLPEAVKTLSGMNVKVMVEAGAGLTAFASDAEYEAAGAVIQTREGVFSFAEFIIKIQPPSANELGLMKEGRVFMSVFNPMVNTSLVKELCNKNITSFSLDILPRTTRAQAMDILSSMATVSGYKAVLTAANNLPKFFPDVYDRRRHRDSR